MSDNDQTAVEAIADILGGDPEGPATSYKEDARAIINAIRKGEVPIPGMVTDKECAMVRCQVKILQGVRDAEKARADKAEADKDRSDKWCEEVMRRLCAAAGVDVVALWQEEPSIEDMETEIRRIRDADDMAHKGVVKLLDKATAECDGLNQTIIEAAELQANVVYWGGPEFRDRAITLWNRRAPDPEREAMARVCAAAVGAAREEKHHQAGPYCRHAAYASRQRLRSALENLDRARKGTT